MNEKQLQMEQHIKAFIQDILDNQSDAILGMLKPSFRECSAEEGTLTLAFPAMHWERNPLGVMQGGVVATILDFAIACLSCWRPPSQKTASVAMNSGPMARYSRQVKK